MAPRGRRISLAALKGAHDITTSLADLGNQQRWTCDGCGVSTGRIDGVAAPLPDTWNTSIEGSFCLVCRRQRAIEAALDSAPSDSGRDDRAKLRRTGLIEFEVRRTPERTDGSIAKTCRTSTATVAAARRRMQTV